MLPTLFAALIAILPPQGSAPQRPPPDPAVVEAARAELARAFDAGEAGERVRALEAHGRVDDAKVAALAAKGLRAGEVEVRKAAVVALRYSPHEDALLALHAFAKQDRALRKDPALYAETLRAIAWHGREASIPVLVEDLWTATEHEVIRARVLGLGRIPSTKSIEALIDLLKIAGPRKTDPHMQEFRTALIVLTGVDRGPSQEGWFAWWNEHKHALRVTATPAELPKPLQVVWDHYWGTHEGEGARGDRRERREKGGREKGGEGGG